MKPNKKKERFAEAVKKHHFHSQRRAFCGKMVYKTYSILQKISRRQT